MKNIIVYDPENLHTELLPITFTRAVGDIRIGLSTLAERWKRYIDGEFGWITEDYLADLYPPLQAEEDTLYIAGNIVADSRLAAEVAALMPGERLVAGENTVAYCGPAEKISVTKSYTGEVIVINHVYDIFGYAEQIVALDFDYLVAQGKPNGDVDSSNLVLGDRSKIYIAPGSVVEGASLNTREGAIIICEGATIMEGSHLRGPLIVGSNCVVNMGTLIYGATTLGPYCKVGGELHNVVMLGYANKAHDGFLGNAVIGEWCNLGGGTVASNLKNDYSEIKLWNYRAGRFLRTGLQFCGLIMGDHSKSAINTSFNTATVVGVGCNIVSEGMPRVFIPSFSKGGTAGFDNVSLPEFFTIARRVMKRRGKELSDAGCRVFEYIYDYAETLK